MRQSDNLLVIAIGSNTDSEYHVKQALNILNEHFDKVCQSSLLRNAPLNMSGNDFVNCIYVAKTSLSYQETLDITKKIEQIMGNQQTMRQEGTVIIDIDILRYNTQRYHEKDWTRTYIQKLWQEVNSQLVHF